MCTSLLRRNNTSICLRLSGRAVGVSVYFQTLSTRGPAIFLALELFSPWKIVLPGDGDFDTVFHFSLACERNAVSRTPSVFLGVALIFLLLSIRLVGCREEAATVRKCAK